MPLRSAIEVRSTSDDDVAAELTLILLETHDADRTALLARHARATSGAWRAVQEMKQKLNEQLNLLSERRKALITAAITGGISV